MIVQVIHLVSLAFFLGFAHAFEADHVVAMSALVNEQSSEGGSASGEKSIWHPSLQGALWGMGHTAMLLAAGGVFLALKLVIPAPLTLLFECFVGIMLVVVGADVARRAIHAAAHRHTHSRPPPHRHRRSFVIGMVHGLAGTGALMLLVAASASSFTGGLFFIAVFGIGSTAGMAMMSTAMSFPIRFLSSRFAAAERVIPAFAGGLSIVLGLSIITGTVLG